MKWSVLHCVLLPIMASGAVSAQPTEITRIALAIDDTGNHNGIIEPGESAVAYVTADLRDDGVNSTGTPAIWNTGGGTGQLGIVWALQSTRFDIRSVANGNTGSWVNLTVTPSLNYLMQQGVPQPDGSVLGVRAAQFCGAVIPCMDTRDPIPLWSATWVPTDYSPRTVQLALANTPGFHSVSLQVWSGGQPLFEEDIWETIDTEIAFQVVPAPGVLPLVTVGLALLARRRRRSGV